MVISVRNLAFFVALVTASSVGVDAYLNKALAQVSLSADNLDNSTLEISNTVASAEGSESTSMEDVSFKASDLLESDALAQRSLNLDVFCKDYPHNSRCQDNTPPSAESAESEESSSESSPDASATSPWGIGVDMSTLGIGATATRRINPHLNIRGAINGFTFGADVEDTDVNYNVDLTLLNVSTLVDYHPLRN